VSAIAFILGSLEMYSYISHNNEIIDGDIRTEYTNGYFTPNNILGYSPNKGISTTAKKYYKDELIYNVNYTIGDDGLRITPQATSNDVEECILIFGGSFTFGEGVNDHSAMPYVVGTLQHHKVHNYGFHGYGPHQMLAAIENGMVACKPTFVIYQAILWHVARVVGGTSWDHHGPKYIMEDGYLKYDGHFDDQKGLGYYIKEKKIGTFIKEKIDAQLTKSYFFKKFFNKDRYTFTDKDIQLFLEIVDASRGKLTEDYPDVEFHVILWDRPDDDNYNKLRDGLQAKLVMHHEISGIIPGALTNRAKYTISAHDHHPGPLAHQLIAKYIVNKIIGIENQRAYE